MAKKKSKNKSGGQPKQPLSPERFMREKARSTPLGKCYISPPNWQEAGMAHVVVTRERSNGNLVMGAFLVDMFCLGVKDVDFHNNMAPDYFDRYLDNLRTKMGVEEISYNEAHNIIYGAIAFAEEGGIGPCLDFKAGRYILEEDTDDIPLIEYEFGKNGKHLLIVHDDRKEMPYYHILKKNLGDNFEYTMPVDTKGPGDGSLFADLTPEDIKRGIEHWIKSREESERHPAEKYAYQYPEYPRTLSVRHQFIADELLSPDNYSCLSRKVIDRILALPHDEAAQDISNIVFYVIGRTYNVSNEDDDAITDNNAIIHSLVLLAQLQSQKGLDAVLEIMRQSEAFSDYHLGDLVSELIRPALYACGQNNIGAIEDYISTPGYYSYMRLEAPAALVMLAFNHPDRRDEVIAVFRRLLDRMVSDLPEQKACDGLFAGFVMADLMDMEATELIPEIKAVFDTDCVDQTIAGDCDAVLGGIEHGSADIDPEKYRIPDIYAQYKDFKSFIRKP